MARVDIRLTNEQKEMLQYIAEQDGRSITKEIIQLIKERYEQLKK